MFQYPITFPKAGMYRVLGDFYPAGATPQLTSETVFVPGEPPPPVASDARLLARRPARTCASSLSTIPEQPVAGDRTQMRFIVDGAHALWSDTSAPGATCWRRATT